MVVGTRESPLDLLCGRRIDLDPRLNEKQQMHFVQHGLREFLTRPRDYSPVVAKHLLFDPDGLLATAAFMGSYSPKTWKSR